MSNLNRFERYDFNYEDIYIIPLTSKFQIFQVHGENN